jgi:hypothetical protein
MLGIGRLNGTFTTKATGMGMGMGMGMGVYSRRVALPLAPTRS